MQISPYISPLRPTVTLVAKESRTLRTLRTRNPWESGILGKARAGAAAGGDGLGEDVNPAGGGWLGRNVHMLQFCLWSRAD